ncbi:MAG: hypothetical protein AB9835_00840 [Eubacteriales bacterium]
MSGIMKKLLSIALAACTAAIPIASGGCVKKDNPADTSSTTKSVATTQGDTPPALVSYTPSDYTEDVIKRSDTQANAISMHYMDDKRDSFAFENLNGSILLGFTPSHGTNVNAITVKGKDAPIASQTCETVIEAQDGTVYSSAQSSSNGRINVYSHGLYFYDIHMLDLSVGGLDSVDAEVIGSYSFAEKVSGWSNVNDFTKPVIKDGRLQIARTGADPYWFNGSTKIDADKATCIRITMKAPGMSGLQVFYQNADGGFAQERSLIFSLRGTDEVKTYTLDMSQSEGWRGNISALRFDIDGQTDGTVSEIEKIELIAPTGDTMPVKFETAYYTYTDKIHEENIIHVLGDAAMKNAYINTSVPEENVSEVYVCDKDGYRRADDLSFDPTTVSAVLLGGKNGYIGYIVPEKTGTAKMEIVKVNGSYSIRQYASLGTSYVKGDKISVARRLWLSDSPDGFEEQIEIEKNPLKLSISADNTDSFAVVDGYDPVLGAYVIGSAGTDFTSAYNDPQFKSSVRLDISNDGPSRSVYVKHYSSTSPGMLECSVLLDSDGYALPVPVQVCKNFAGENEEPFYRPGDPAFGDSYFTAWVEKGKRLDISSLHLFQNWGNHPLKQISSILFFTPYYHLSTGVTETTCWAPLLYGNKNGFMICDYRSFSNTMWDSQPQFDTIGEHRFMIYKSKDKDTRDSITYRSTDIKSMGPNYSDMALNYITDDNTADVSIRPIEIPQTDETRVATSVSVTFRDTLTIADASSELCLYEFGSALTGTYFRRFSVLDESNNPVEKVIDFSSPGETIKLGDQAPFFAFYDVDETRSGNKGNAGAIITSFKAVIGGVEYGMDDLSFNLKTVGGAFVLGSFTINAKELTFNAGDTISYTLIHMPYGSFSDRNAQSVIETRRDFALSPFKVSSETSTVTVGYIPTVAAKDGKASFKTSGGASVMAVRVEGFAGYHPPKLTVNNGGTWEEISYESAPGAKDGSQCYLCSDGTYGFVLLVDAGQEKEYKVEYLS